MSCLSIIGGKRLFGELRVSGSKNAALPIIFAALAVPSVSTLENVPDIGDVRVALEAVSAFGAKIKRDGSTVIIDARRVKYKRPKAELTSKIRASSYLIGACLARFGRFDFARIGGCDFCRRPVDMHLLAAERLGAVSSGDTLTASRLRGAEIKFEKPSVGATINAIIMATFAEGETVIYGAAREPHVRNLIGFLESGGALIEDDGEKIRIKGSPPRDPHVRIIPDMIEAGTFLLLGPLTDGRVTVLFDGEIGLDSFFNTLSESGVSVEIKKGAVSAYGIPKKRFGVVTAPYPGFPTDLQPQCAPLMAKYFGGSIRECVWQSRFSYLSELSRFGLRYELSGRDTAIIIPSELRPASVSAPDLRGGAATVLAALSQRGESVISDTEKIERGYERFAEKLRSLGADIK